MTDDQERESRLAESIKSMTPEQFEKVKGVVQQEATRRDDPSKRLGNMTDNELQEFKDRAMGQ